MNESVKKVVQKCSVWCINTPTATQTHLSGDTEMTKLTTAQMIEIIESKKIEECTPEQKAQVMAFAFGEDFVESEDKGSVAFYG